MSLQRVAGVDVAVVVLRPEVLLALERYVRGTVLLDSRLTGDLRDLLVEAARLLNGVAAGVAEPVRGRPGWSSTGAGTGRAGEVLPATPSVPSGPRDAGRRVGTSSRSSSQQLLSEGPTWISVNEAAQRLGRSEGYVRRLCRQRRLRARSGVAGGWQIDPADVATWIPNRIDDERTA